jgi:hypothetical protein
MNQKIGSIPFGVLLMVLYYTFGALFLLYFFIAQSDAAVGAIAARHGLPPTTGAWILPVIATLSIFLSLGLFSRSRWGYALAVLYQIYFGGANLVLYHIHGDLMHMGCLIWSILVLVYLIIVRNWFTGRQLATRVIRTNPGQI